MANKPFIQSENDADRKFGCFNSSNLYESFNSLFINYWDNKIYHVDYIYKSALFWKVFFLVKFDIQFTTPQKHVNKIANST